MTDSSKPKILIVGDAVVPSGFARVIRSIFGPLRDDFELHQLATRYNGEAHNYHWPLHRAAAGNSVYGYDQLIPLIETVKPQIVFLLYDISFQPRYLEIFNRALPAVKSVIYSPVESGPIATELMKNLQGVTRYVTFTNYGRVEINKAIDQIRADSRDFRFPEVDVIPHGVDTASFYPLSEREDSEFGAIPERRILGRKALGFDDPEHLNAFIVLNANRNMPRKRIDITMRGFAEFARDKPAGVKLYLHMATEDTGWNVLVLAKRYGIFDRLIMTRADNARPTFSDEQLNLLYNACDVGINTTTGEAWGMVSFEHAATRAAQVIPRHTAQAELWKGAAEFVDPEIKLTYPGNLTDAHIVTPQRVARALERLYEDSDYRESLADAAFKNATRPELSWNVIAGQWKGLFHQVVDQL